MYMYHLITSYFLLCFFTDRVLQTSSSISLSSTQNYYIEVLNVVNGLSVLSVGVVDLLNILSSLSSQKWFNSIRLGNFKSYLISVCEEIFIGK